MLYRLSCLFIYLWVILTDRLKKTIAKVVVKMKKKVLIISLTPIVLAVSIFAAVRAVNYYRVKKQTDLKIAYYRQNKYFAALLSRYKYEFEYWHQYLPLDFETNHIDGIRAETYMNIACYRSESGGSMTYAQVIDYL